MIGNGLKKYAAQKNFEGNNGVAYGVYNGYLVTLKEGLGYKSMTFAVAFQEESTMMAIRSILEDKALQKHYRLNGFAITGSHIEVRLVDQWGTMKRLDEFLDFFVEQLTARSIQGVGVCSVCGLTMNESQGNRVLLNGSVLQMHKSCMEQTMNDREEFRTEVQKTGSVALGSIGATLGAVIGSIPWIIAYYFGWFVGWLGFLIGIAAKKGYELFRGKETKTKGIVIILVVVLTVVFAEFVTYMIAFHFEILADPELLDMSLNLFDMAQAIVWTFLEDAAFRSATLMDIALGWLFAGLGVFSTLREIFSEASALEQKILPLDERI